MSEPNDWNRQVIEEFRANEGRVGGFFEGRTLLLLHHTGAKTGSARINPVAYQRRGDSYAIFASKAGAPTNPDWFHNLKAHPDVEVEVGTQRFPVRARVAGKAERDEIFGYQKADWPGFGDYEEKTKGIREIPVVVLDPAP
ncbi:MAG: nitroreductase family deazaflavin-dependent oxidoreductase [Actinomycetota bacterium]